jgi:hypothetical protein
LTVGALDSWRTLALQPLGPRADALLAADPVDLEALARELGDARYQLLLSLVALDRHRGTRARRAPPTPNVEGLVAAARCAHPRLFGSTSFRHAAMEHASVRKDSPTEPPRLTKITEVSVDAVFSDTAPRLRIAMAVNTADSSGSLRLVLSPSDLAGFASVLLAIFAHVQEAAKTRPAARKEFDRVDVRKALHDVRTTAARLLRSRRETKRLMLKAKAAKRARGTSPTRSRKKAT